jgi:hypothetical protein
LFSTQQAPVENPHGFSEQVVADRNDPPSCWHSVSVVFLQASPAIQQEPVSKE